MTVVGDVMCSTVHVICSHQKSRILYLNQESEITREQVGISFALQ